MVRLLIIGRPADDWSARLDAHTDDDLQIDTERLPAAGVRAFESTPADLIVVAADRPRSRVATLVDAIRQRPLGQLVPLVVISPVPDDVDTRQQIEQLQLVDWHTPDISPEVLLGQIGDELDVDLTSTADRESPKPRRDSRGDRTEQPPGSAEATAGRDVDGVASAESTSDDGRASYFDGNIVLERVDREPDEPESVRRNSLFRGTHSGVDDSDTAITERELKQRLKAVRHDDYYAILDVRRGAESQTVRQAFSRLYERFDPDSMPFELVREHQNAIDEIRDALEDAFAVLGDPELRRAYLEHTVK